MSNHPTSDSAPALARLSLKIILALGLAGTAFSGSLVYRELGIGGASCPATSATIAGVPVCVYGLLMFLFISTAAAWGLAGSSRPGVTKHGVLHMRDHG